MAKMDKKWVILCSSAVAAIYASGYFTTEAQAQMTQPKQQTLANIQQSNSSHSHRMVLRSNQENSGKKSSTNTKSTTKSTSQYKDGTYQGTGMNRRGMIQVAVTIKSDKIADVHISGWGMHYSESDIVGLPNEVLQNQSAQVSNVSGATYSTMAFEQAVQDALSKAQNA